MTDKTICKRCVLLTGLHRRVFFVTMPYAPTPQSLTLQIFLDFFLFSLQIFPLVALQKSDLRGTSGNLQRDS